MNRKNRFLARGGDLARTLAAKGAMLVMAGATTLLPFQSLVARPPQVIVDVLTPGEVTLPCLVGRSPLLHGPDTVAPGEAVVLDPEELNRRATRTASITVPRGTTIPDSVAVSIVIDEDGRVLCAALSNYDAKRLGSIGTLAIEAAKKWLFQPVLNHTKPVLCIGDLELKVVTEQSPAGSPVR